MSDWPDNPVEADSFGMYSYYERNRAKGVMKRFKEDSPDPYHQYELRRAKKILETEPFDVENQYTPVNKK